MQELLIACEPQGMYLENRYCFKLLVLLLVLLLVVVLLLVLLVVLLFIIKRSTILKRVLRPIRKRICSVVFCGG